MAVYVAQWVGTGTRQDPFRPEGVSGNDWTTIDLRDDPTQPGGRCLVYSSAALSGPTRLGELTDALTNQQRTVLAQRFGVDFSSDATVLDALKRVVLPRLQARGGVKEIWLANRQVYRGG